MSWVGELVSFSKPKDATMIWVAKLFFSGVMAVLLRQHEMNDDELQELRLGEDPRDVDVDIPKLGEYLICVFIC